MTYEDALRAWVRDQMRAKQVSQRELAAALGVSQGTVSMRLRLEDDRRQSSMTPDGWAETIEVLGGSLVCYATDGQSNEAMVPVPRSRTGAFRAMAHLDDDHFQALMAFADLWSNLTSRERLLVQLFQTVADNALPAAEADDSKTTKIASVVQTVLETVLPALSEDKKQVW